MCTHKHQLLFKITFDFYVVFIKYLRRLISKTANKTNNREERGIKQTRKQHENLSEKLQRPTFTIKTPKSSVHYYRKEKKKKNDMQNQKC